MAHQQESFLPFSSRQSLSCCLSRVAKRSTPNHMVLSTLLQNRVVLFPISEPRGPLFTSPKLPDPGPLPFPSEPRGTLLFYFRTTWTSIYLLASEPHAWFSLFTSEPHGLLLSHPKPCGPPPSMSAVPRFKSQHPSSFAAPFPTPPTVSYTCQHPRILPSFLGCHSKSGQVWPLGVEPIISTLSRRPCNQGELLPSPILGGIWSHPPGSKHNHSYLTYL